MSIGSQRKKLLSESHQVNTPVSRAMKKNSRWKIFFIAWAVFSFMAGLWTIATPISAAPDEPAHIIKAASVALGQFVGAATSNGQRVDVPAYIAFTPAQTCYAFNDTVTANCAPVESGNLGALVSSTTSAGLYNPVYYLLVGWPSLVFHDDAGIYAMRFMSGIIASIFLALAVMMISTWTRRLIPLLGLAVASTPMVLFLNGVVNPNSLEITATLAAFVGVLSIVLHRRDALTTERCVIVLISAAVAVNTRGISPLWVGVALFAPLLLAPWPRVRGIIKIRSVQIMVVGVGLATGAALLWTALSNSLGTGPTTASASTIVTGTGIPPGAAFLKILMGTFQYGQGLVGVFGWLDTPVPDGVFFLWSVFIGLSVLAAVILLTGRPLAFVLIMAALLVVLPPLTQALYAPAGGIIWQGRYVLALYACVMVGAAAVLGLRFPPPSPRIAARLSAVFCVLWSVAQFHAFVTALRRYAVGADGPGSSWQRMVLDPSWSVPGGNITVIAVFIVVFATGAILLHRLATSGSKSSRAFDNVQAR